MNKSLVQQQFGTHAAAYATSSVHAKGASLARLVELVRPEPHWQALDIATGAGHTAGAFAPRVARLLRDAEPPAVDVLLVHDARTAARSGHLVPLVLAGHTHQREQGVIGDATLLVQGFTGGAGRRGVAEDEAERGAAQVVLAVDPRRPEHRAVVVIAHRERAVEVPVERQIGAVVPAHRASTVGIVLAHEAVVRVRREHAWGRGAARVLLPGAEDDAGQSHGCARRGALAESVNRER